MALVDNRVGEMVVFVRVVEAGSFSEAARLLHMTPSTVSKLIVRLENRLGARLVERSTRRLSLTKEGHFYHERSQALLAQLDETEQQVARGGNQPDGVVRVNASVSFGTRGLEPILPAFWAAYPKIIVDLTLSDEIVDLYLDRTDVAFRVGRLEASNLVARKIGVARRKIVGSPDYLARRGVPKKPEDLLEHDCLGFNFRRAAPVWPFSEGGRIAPRMLNGSLIANNGETVGRMALAGVGLARLGDYHVREHIARGELVEVLADSAIADAEDIHAVSPGGNHMPRRVRAFLDFVVPRLKRYLRPG
jgi:DNA-binding transcriptional LysR family regulator